ncbi:4Fe-4S single cluster domain of Ferredoxin I [Natronincola peptidivorans]|uniref:4Fe-4S single cluster domain of Ferredoxin I n=1 Tax=Natronincola peptidivorans TaxID=426128 RepID=A0A1I0C6B7_9FIRM|nr:permease [Natronincola peptidivorans]SET14978.1 4Fe-4S single cluster domain of Ferredoxin I [Natronincola peptidivorans]
MLFQSIKKYKLIFITMVLYLVTFIFSQGLFIQALQNTRHYLLEMLVVMPVIFMLTVLIEIWISKESIMKNLGESSGLKGFGFSVILGSLSAGPIYAAFPICKMLLSKGASIVNIVVILSAWAVIKVPMLANEARFLGPKFMVIRWILTVISIYFMAYIMGILIKKEDIPQMKSSNPDGLSINEDYCVGCSICVKMLPGAFEMNQKKAQVKAIDLDSSNIPAIMKIIEKCPTKAISLSSKGLSPQ